MTCRAFVRSAFISALVLCVAPATGKAQNDPTVIKSASSSGIAANVVGLVYRQNQLSAQLILHNNNKVRVYLLNARSDDSQIAFLGSGEHTNSPFPAGVPFCNGSYAQCIANPNDVTIDKISYIEPGESLAVAMKYQVQQKPSDHDTISFSVTFVARFARSDISPDEAGPVKRVTLSFPFLPLP